MDTQTYAIKSIAMLSVLIITAAVYMVFLLKASRFNTDVYMPFLARQIVRKNLTPVQKTYGRQLLLTLALGTFIALTAKLVHNRKAAATIIAAIFIGVLALIIVNLPSSIRGNIEWYRALSPDDKKIFKRHVRYSVFSVLGAVIPLGILYAMAITLK